MLKECPVCKQMFDARTTWQKYDKPQCRDRAHKMKKKAERNPQ